MDRQLLAGYYLRSDLFLFPSTFDTASLAPIEASALKLPTLMTKGCSTAEIITDNQNGFLEIGDSNAWADKILDIISDKKKLLEVKEKAYTEVYKTWDQVVDEMRKFYTFAIEDYNSKKK
jgi:glycosyltransferase involved in cell wall biosynthesis